MGGSVIPDFSRARIAVVGDAMLDRWIYGRVERISPEAPIPVFVQEREETKPGGAANVAEGLKALGCEVVLCCDKRKTIKTRFSVDGIHQQLMRWDIEDCKPICPRREEAIMEDVAYFGADVLVLSDYGKGVFGGSLASRLINWAIDNDCKVVVDPKGKDWSKYRGADVVTPNLKEWFEVTTPFDGIGAILLKRGAEGMSLIRQSQDRYDIPGRKVEVRDVCGCGDTVIATLAACLAVGLDLETSAQWANIAASVVVTKPGTAVCTRAELEAATLRG